MLVMVVSAEAVGLKPESNAREKWEKSVYKIAAFGFIFGGVLTGIK
jgi:hypothetical protein